MYRQNLLVGFVSLFSIGIILLAGRNNKKHEVVYKVYGQTTSSSLTIRYLDVALRRDFDAHLRTDRVPTHALPWSKTVYLPVGSVAYVSVAQEPNKSSSLRVNIMEDGRQRVDWPAPGDENPFEFRVGMPG